jgi:primase-polymerase (primpol)-like protein
MIPTPHWSLVCSVSGVFDSTARTQPTRRIVPSVVTSRESIYTPYTVNDVNADGHEEIAFMNKEIEEAISTIRLDRAHSTDIDAIPGELRSQRRWVVAQNDDRDGRQAKVPYCAESGQKASTTNPATWSDFATASEAIRHGRFPFLGFVFGEGLVGVDLDHCRDASTGAVEPWAKAIVARLNSYTEVSVNGTGLHIICKGSLPVSGRRKGAVEMYASGRYFVMTGKVLRSGIADRAKELAALYDETFGKPVSTSEADRVVCSEFSDQEVLARTLANGGKRCQSLWCGDAKEYTSDSEADLALCRYFWRSGADRDQIDRLFRESGLYRAKWERADYRNATIATASESRRPSLDVDTIDQLERDGHGGELRQTHSYDSRGASRRNSTTAGSSHATKVINHIRDSGVTFFHTSDNQPWATVTIQGHRETMRVKSDRFRGFIANEYFQRTGDAPSESAMKSALGMFTALALQGSQHQVFVRVARTNDEVHIDLGRSDWNVVKVTPFGWTVAPSEVRFWRPDGVLPLPEPIRTSDSFPSLLRPLVNVQNDDDLQLLMGWLIGTLRGIGPYPILSVNGEQGTAKSTTCRLMRRLIDPNQAPLRLLPKDTRDLLIAATNSHVLAFDNLSRIPDWMSDVFCGLATGTGFATRSMYANADEYIFSAARPIIVNGINEVITRSDLLDRAVVVTLEPIPDGQRCRESEIEKRFQWAHPRILACLLDAVSEGLKNEATTMLSRAPRMADFATWVTAAEPALHQPHETFLRAYSKNRRMAVENSIDGDPIVDVLRGLPLPWSGQIQRLLDQIPDGEHKPNTPKALGNILRRIAPAIRQVGLQIENTRSRGQRIITISRMPKSGSLRLVPPVVDDGTQERHEPEQADTLVA